MENMDNFLERFRQNDKLPIRIVSPHFGQLSSDVVKKQGAAHRKAYFFFIFMIDGSTRHLIDLQQFEVSNNELLFILPNQIHEFPAKKRV